MALKAPHLFTPLNSNDPAVTDLYAPLNPTKTPAQVAAAVAAGTADNYRNRNVSNTTPVQLVANAASVRVLPQNPRRTGLLIQNKDPVSDLFIGFGQKATINSLSVAPGGYVLLDFTTPNSEVYAFATANIQAVFVDMSRGT